MTIYLDFMVLSGRWTLAKDSTTESAFWIVNLLALGFLFGERAMKNVTPIIGKHFGKKNG